MNQTETKTIQKPKLRKAEIEDFEKVYPLLQEMNNTRLSKDDWFKLFKNHWNIEEFSPGMVLEMDKKMVGYIGTVYSKQMIADQPQLFCNLSSWIVQEEYRSYSIMMILPLVRNKNVILTSFSSNKVTYEVYKKLGFKDGNSSKRIVYPLPSLRSKNYQLVTDIEQIRTTINDDAQAVFNDHRSFGNACILITFGNEQCLLMGVNRNKHLNIYYASNRPFMKKHLSGFRGKLMSLFKVKKMIINENLLAGGKVFLSRKVSWGNPYQYKTSKKYCLDPMPVYSEIFLLNM